MLKRIDQNNRHARMACQPHMLLLWGLLPVCLLLLSACNALNPASAQGVPSPAATHAPTVSAALQQQGNMQLQAFQQWISLMQRYGGKVDTYQQQYNRDMQSLKSANSDKAYQAALNTLKEQTAAIQLPALQTQTQSLQQKLSQEASAWNNQHTYYDSYNGQTYHLGYEYTGLQSYPVPQVVESAQTIADYQYAIEQLNTWQANFDAYKTNFSDQTPYDQVHQTDTQLMHRYGFTSGQVLVISLSEQAMRVYENGKLVKSFLVVTGMPGHPSLPGSWWIETRQTDMEFTSGKHPGDDGYYPSTPIAFAMLYHSGGYYIYQSWWRSQYGPGNQFPHVDPNGTAFAYEGSHGCVNMSTATVEWVYNFVQVNSTRILIY